MKDEVCSMKWIFLIENKNVGIFGTLSVSAGHFSQWQTVSDNLSNLWAKYSVMDLGFLQTSNRSRKTWDQW